MGLLNYGITDMDDSYEYDHLDDYFSTPWWGPELMFQVTFINTDINSSLRRRECVEVKGTSSFDAREQFHQQHNPEGNLLILSIDPSSE